MDHGNEPARGRTPTSRRPPRRGRSRPHARATVIGEMSVQFLHPNIGGELKRDLGFPHLVLRGANGVGPCTAGAPVERTSITVPASIATASSGAVA